MGGEGVAISHGGGEPKKLYAQSLLCDGNTEMNLREPPHPRHHARHPQLSLFHTFLYLVVIQ